MSSEADDGPLALVHAWVTAFNHTDPARVSALYAPDAALWGTFAGELITTPEGVRAYFERALAGPDRPLMRLQSAVVQPVGDGAVVSGAYDLCLAPAVDAQALPARFSFVLARCESRWLILHHHSSIRPAVERAQ